MQAIRSTRCRRSGARLSSISTVECIVFATQSVGHHTRLTIAASFAPSVSCVLQEKLFTQLDKVEAVPGVQVNTGGTNKEVPKDMTHDIDMYEGKNPDKRIGDDGEFSGICAVGIACPSLHIIDLLARTELVAQRGGSPNLAHRHAHQPCPRRIRPPPAPRRVLRQREGRGPAGQQ